MLALAEQLWQWGWEGGGYMTHASSGTEWGDTRSGGTGWRLQKKVQKIWEWLAIGSQGREEEGTPMDSRMLGPSDWE